MHIPPKKRRQVTTHCTAEPEAASARPKRPVRLTGAQLAFVGAYKGNASAAARAVGLHPQYGRKLFRRPEIREAIERLAAEQKMRQELTPGELVTLWTEIARDPNVPINQRIRATRLLLRVPEGRRAKALAEMPEEDFSGASPRDSLRLLQIFGRGARQAAGPAPAAGAAGRGKRKGLRRERARET